MEKNRQKYIVSVLLNNSATIFRTRIWNPGLGEAISTRNVTFGEDEYCNKDLEQFEDDIQGIHELNRKKLARCFHNAQH